MKPEHVILAALAWAALALLAWAVIHGGARDDPPEWDEPEDGQPPLDPYVADLASRN